MLPQKKTGEKFFNAQWNLSLWEPVIVLLASFTVTFLVARNVFGQTLILGDTPWANHQSAEILWQYAFNIWNPAAYGDITPKPQGYLIMFLFAKLAQIFGDFSIYNFFMHLALPLGFISFYHFSKKFCNNISTRILGSTLYLINPITISYFSAGAFMWTLVFLPLSINYFIDLLEDRRYLTTLKATLFASLTIWTLTSIAFILVLGLLTTVLSYIITAKNKRTYVKSISTNLLFYAFLLVLCLLPYIYSTIIYMQSPLFNLGGDILSDFQYTYGEATIPNMLRLAGNVGSPQSKFDYNSSTNLGNEIGYIIPLLAFLSILWVKGSDKKQRVIAATILLSLVILSALFIRFASSSELKWILTDFMPLWTLRNPFKIQLLLLNAIIPLFIFGTENLFFSLIKFFKPKKSILILATVALTFLVVLPIYLYNAFAFNGYAGVDKYPGMDQATPDETLTRIVEESLSLPEIGDFRGLILPFDHKTELYVEYSNMFIYPCRLGQQSNISNAINRALDERLNFENILRLFSIKYVYLNNMWEDSGYLMIPEQNPPQLLACLNKTYNANNNREYSKIVLEDALPTIYVSSFPVFYSNIETIALLEPSMFQYKPVFIEIKDLGCNITTYDGKSSKTFYYSFDNPYPETYNLYAIAYFDQPETNLSYKLDNAPPLEKVIKEELNSFKNIAQIQLQPGNHNLSITVDNVTTFADLPNTFINNGNGTYNVEGQSIRIENGTLVGLSEFEDFDLTLKFKVLNYGDETWHGPFIYFTFTDDSYYRVIFHENGYVELSKYYQGMPQSFLALKRTNFNFKDFNNLRIIKVSDTVTLYLNKQYVFSFKEQTVNKTGKIGLSSYLSATIFDDVTITRNIIKEILIIPEGKIKTTSIKMLQTAPGYYAFQLDSQESSWILLFLGENYDPLWEVTINGTSAVSHLNANIFGNCWTFNASQGSLNVQIFYRPNMSYQPLFLISLIIEIALIIGAFFPQTIKQKIFLLPHKFSKVKKGDFG